MLKEINNKGPTTAMSVFCLPCFQWPDSTSRATRDGDIGAGQAAGGSRGRPHRGLPAGGPYHG